MSDYIKTKEYKFPDGETVTAYFDEYGIAKITIQVLDAIFDNYINSADRVEVVRCKDCRYWRDTDHTCKYSFTSPMCANEFCSYGERTDNGRKDR